MNTRRMLGLLMLATTLVVGVDHAGAATDTGGTDAVRIATLYPLGNVCPQAFLDTLAFNKDLKDLGYDPRTLVVAHCFSELADLPRLTSELLKDKPSLVAIWGSAVAARLVRQAASTIPIVFVDIADPVASGLTDSLSHPSGNMTGISNNTNELVAKRAQLLREALPRATRLGVLSNLANPLQSDYLRTLQESAQTLKWQTRTYDVRNQGDLAGAFAAMQRDGMDAMFLLPDAWFFPNREEIIALARRYRLPAMYGNSAFPDLGALFTYGANLDDMNHKAATYIDKILKGVKPADLPVELPTKFDFVINAKTARELGLNIPQAVLLRATRVIE